MRVSTSELYKLGYGKFALGAFNVCSLEQIHGLFRGAVSANAPIISAFTKAARDYAHPEMLEHMLRAAEKIYPEVIFSVHLDHGDEKTCYEAVQSGNYNSVMIDASHYSFEKNIEITSRIVKAAHAKGIVVEAELGVLSGVEDNISVDEKKSMFTDPDEALKFVEATGCDSLAVAIGTKHGAYKFTEGQGLNFKILDEIVKRLPGFPIVLHGASSVPKEEVIRINNAGGKISISAKGTSENEVKEAIKKGVCKVNIGTDGRIVWTRVFREYFNDHPENFDFSSPGKIYVEEYAKLVAQKCQMLNSEGCASELISQLRM